MSFRTSVSAFGTVVVCRGCGYVVIDEERPSEREVEEACEEHDCKGGPTWA